MPPSRGNSRGEAAADPSDAAADLERRETPQATSTSQRAPAEEDAPPVAAGSVRVNRSPEKSRPQSTAGDGEEGLLEPRPPSSRPPSRKPPRRAVDVPPPVGTEEFPGRGEGEEAASPDSAAGNEGRGDDTARVHPEPPDGDTRIHPEPASPSESPPSSANTSPTSPGDDVPGRAVTENKSSAGGSAAGDKGVPEEEGEGEGGEDGTRQNRPARRSASGRREGERSSPDILLVVPPGGAKGGGKNPLGNGPAPMIPTPPRSRPASGYFGGRARLGVKPEEGEEGPRGADAEVDGDAESAKPEGEVMPSMADLQRVVGELKSEARLAEKQELAMEELELIKGDAMEVTREDIQAAGVMGDDNGGGERVKITISADPRGDGALVAMHFQGKPGREAGLETISAPRVTSRLEESLKRPPSAQSRLAWSEAGEDDYIRPGSSTPAWSNSGRKGGADGGGSDAGVRWADGKDGAEGQPDSHDPVEGAEGTGGAAPAEGEKGGDGEGTAVPPDKPVGEGVAGAGAGEPPKEGEVTEAPKEGEVTEAPKEGKAPTEGGQASGSGILGRTMDGKLQAGNMWRKAGAQVQREISVRRKPRIYIKSEFEKVAEDAYSFQFKKRLNRLSLLGGEDGAHTGELTTVGKSQRAVRRLSIGIRAGLTSSVSKISRTYQEKYETVVDEVADSSLYQKMFDHGIKVHEFLWTTRNDLMWIAFAFAVFFAGVVVVGWYIGTGDSVLDWSVVLGGGISCFAFMSYFLYAWVYVNRRTGWLQVLWKVWVKTSWSDGERKTYSVAALSLIVALTYTYTAGPADFKGNFYVLVAGFPALFAFLGYFYAKEFRVFWKMTETERKKRRRRAKRNVWGRSRRLSRRMSSGRMTDSDIEPEWGEHEEETDDIDESQFEVSTYDAWKWILDWMWNTPDQRPNFLKVCAEVVVQVAISLGQPIVLEMLLDQAIPEADFRQMVILLILLVILVAVSAQTDFLMANDSPSGGGFVPHWQLKLGRHVSNLPQQFLDSKNLAHIMTTIDTDVNTLNDSVDAWFEGVKSFMVTIANLSLLATFSVPLTLAIMTVFPLMYRFNKLSGTKVMKSSDNLRKAEKDLGAAVEENLTRASTKKVLGLHTVMDNQMYKEGKKVEDGHTAVDLSVAQNVRGLRGLSFLMDLVVIGVGGVFLAIGYITMGQFFVFYLNSRDLEGLIVEMTETLQQFNKSRSSLRSLLALTNIEEHDFSNATVDILEKRHDIEFKNVTFWYHDEGTGHKNTVVDDMCLKIPKGMKVGVISRSGGGKSTFLKIISRLYRPFSGEVYIADVALGDVDLYSTVATVEQEVKLFSGTIKSNICVGMEHEMREDETLEAMKAASMLAGLHDDVAMKEGGYDYDVGYHGVRLSGGQQQRVCIARALLREAPILVMDEPTSAQDPEKTEAIGNNLSSMRDTSIVCSTHTLSLLKAFDLVLVLGDGRVAEYGTKEEVMALKGVYYKMITKMEGFQKDSSGQVSIAPDRLRSIWLFSKIQTMMLVDLAKMFFTRTANPGETIFNNDTVANTLIVLVEGAVEEVIPGDPVKGSKDKRLKMWDVGDSAGESCICATHEMRWETTAKAASKCTMLLLPKQSWNVATLRSPEMGQEAEKIAMAVATARSHQRLQSVWSMSGLTVKHLTRMATMMSVRLVDDGDYLFRMPDRPCRSIYIVVDGNLTINVHSPGIDENNEWSERTDTIKAGNVFGALTLVWDDPSGEVLWSCVAKDRTIVLEMHMEEFKMLCSENARIRRVIESNVDSLEKLLTADFFRPSWVFTWFLRGRESKALLASFTVEAQIEGVSLVAKDFQDDRCYVVLKGSCVAESMRSDDTTTTKVMEAGAIINPIGLVGNPESFGERIINIEVAEPNTVVVCITRKKFVAFGSEVDVTAGTEHMKHLRDIATKRAWYKKTANMKKWFELGMLDEEQLATLEESVQTIVVEPGESIFNLKLGRQNLKCVVLHGEVVTKTVHDGEDEVLTQEDMFEADENQVPAPPDRPDLAIDPDMISATVKRAGKKVHMVQAARASSRGFAVVMVVDMSVLSDFENQRRMQEDAHLQIIQQRNRELRRALQEADRGMSTCMQVLGLKRRFHRAKMWKVACSKIKIYRNLGVNVNETFRDTGAVTAKGASLQDEMNLRKHQLKDYCKQIYTRFERIIQQEKEWRILATTNHLLTTTFKPEGYDEDSKEYLITEFPDLLDDNRDVNTKGSRFKSLASGVEGGIRMMGKGFAKGAEGGEEGEAPPEEAPPPAQNLSLGELARQAAARKAAADAFKVMGAAAAFKKVPAGGGGGGGGDGGPVTESSHGSDLDAYGALSPRSAAEAYAAKGKAPAAAAGGSGGPVTESLSVVATRGSHLVAMAAGYTRPSRPQVAPSASFSGGRALPGVAASADDDDDDDDADRLPRRSQLYSNPGRRLVKKQLALEFPSAGPRAAAAASASNPLSSGPSSSFTRPSSRWRQGSVAPGVRAGGSRYGGLSGMAVFAKEQSRALRARPHTSGGDGSMSPGSVDMAGGGDSKGWVPREEQAAPLSPASRILRPYRDSPPASPDQVGILPAPGAGGVWRTPVERLPRRPKSNKVVVEILDGSLASDGMSDRESDIDSSSESEADAVAPGFPSPDRRAAASAPPPPRSASAASASPPRPSTSRGDHQEPVSFWDSIAGDRPGWGTTLFSRKARKEREAARAREAAAARARDDAWERQRTASMWGSFWAPSSSSSSKGGRVTVIEDDEDFFDPENPRVPSPIGMPRSPRAAGPAPTGFLDEAAAPGPPRRGEWDWTNVAGPWGTGAGFGPGPVTEAKIPLVRPEGEQGGGGAMVDEEDERSDRSDESVKTEDATVDDILDDLSDKFGSARWKDWDLNVVRLTKLAEKIEGRRMELNMARKHNIDLLRALWIRFEVPVNRTRDFELLLPKGVGPEVFTKIRREVQTQRAKLAVPLKAQKNRLEKLWEELNVPDNQKTEFATIDFQEVTEDLFEKVRSEVAKLEWAKELAKPLVMSAAKAGGGGGMRMSSGWDPMAAGRAKETAEQLDLVKKNVNAARQGAADLKEKVHGALQSGENSAKDIFEVLRQTREGISDMSSEAGGALGDAAAAMEGAADGLAALPEDADADTLRAHIKELESQLRAGAKSAGEGEGGITAKAKDLAAKILAKEERAEELLKALMGAKGGVNNLIDGLEAEWVTKLMAETELATSDNEGLQNEILMLRDEVESLQAQLDVERDEHDEAIAKLQEDTKEDRRMLDEALCSHDPMMALNKLKADMDIHEEEAKKIVSARLEKEALMVNMASKATEMQVFAGVDKVRWNMGPRKKSTAEDGTVVTEAFASEKMPLWQFWKVCFGAASEDDDVQVDTVAAWLRKEKIPFSPRSLKNFARMCRSWRGTLSFEGFQIACEESENLLKTVKVKSSMRIIKANPLLGKADENEDRDHGKSIFTFITDLMKVRSMRAQDLWKELGGDPLNPMEAEDLYAYFMRAGQEFEEADMADFLERVGMGKQAKGDRGKNLIYFKDFKSCLQELARVEIQEKGGHALAGTAAAASAASKLMAAAGAGRRGSAVGAAGGGDRRGSAAGGSDAGGGDGPAKPGGPSLDRTFSIDMDKPMHNQASMMGLMEAAAAVRETAAVPKKKSSGPKKSLSKVVSKAATAAAAGAAASAGSRRGSVSRRVSDLVPVTESAAEGEPSPAKGTGAAALLAAAAGAVAKAEADGGGEGGGGEEAKDKGAAAAGGEEGAAAASGDGASSSKSSPEKA